MAIKIERLSVSSVDDWAESLGLDIVVRERDVDKFNDNSKFYASIPSIEIKNGSILISTFGNGRTPEESIRNLAKELSCKRLVIDAMTDERREVFSPKLT